MTTKKTLDICAVYIVTSWVVDEREHPTENEVEAACGTLSGACEYVSDRCSVVVMMSATPGRSADFADAHPLNPKYFAPGTITLGRDRWRIERIEVKP